MAGASSHTSMCSWITPAHDEVDRLAAPVTLHKLVHYLAPCDGLLTHEIWAASHNGSSRVFAEQVSQARIATQSAGSFELHKIEDKASSPVSAVLESRIRQ
jgi:hypothetical protein